MYKYFGILFFLISADLTAQEIPDYKGEYVFTNSRVSMEGIRELISHQFPKLCQTATFWGRYLAWEKVLKYKNIELQEEIN